MLKLLLSLEVERQLHHERPLACASCGQLVFEKDGDVNQDDLVLLGQLEHVSVHLRHDLEQTVGLLLVVVVVHWGMH